MIKARGFSRGSSDFWGLLFVVFVVLMLAYFLGPGRAQLARLFYPPAQISQPVSFTPVSKIQLGLHHQGFGDRNSIPDTTVTLWWVTEPLRGNRVTSATKMSEVLVPSGKIVPIASVASGTILAELNQNRLLPDSFHRILPNGSMGVELQQPLYVKFLQRVRGQVLDNTGKPLPGVTVSSGSRSVLTDQNGRYEIAGPTEKSYNSPLGSVRLIISKLGFARIKDGQHFAQVPVPVSLDALQEEPLVVDPIVLTPSPIVEGLVTDDKGKTVSGATVHFWIISGDYFHGLGQTETDSQGYYRFTAPNRTAAFYANCNLGDVVGVTRFTTLTLENQVTTAALEPIVLKPTVELEINIPGGRNPNLSVTPLSQHPQLPSPLKNPEMPSVYGGVETSKRNNSTILIKSLLPGSLLSLQIQDQFGTTGWMETRVPLKNGGPPLSVQMTPFRDLRGRVMGDDNLPLSDAYVYTTENHFIRGAQTDQEGNFELKGIPSTVSRLRVNSAAITDNNQFLDFSFERGTSQTLRVILAQDGRAKLQSIQAHLQTLPTSSLYPILATSALDGKPLTMLEISYLSDMNSLRRIGPGHWELHGRYYSKGSNIRLSSLGYAAKNVLLPQPGTTITVGMEPTGTIRGRVLDRLGRPASQLKVTANSVQYNGSFGDFLPIIRQGEEPGRFAVTNLTSGTYDLDISANHGLDLISTRTVLQGMGIDLDLGDLTLPDHPTARVRVVNLSGEPVAGVEVDLYDTVSRGDQYDRPVRRSATTDEQGYALVKSSTENAGMLFIGGLARALVQFRENTTQPVTIPIGTGSMKLLPPSGNLIKDNLEFIAPNGLTSYLQNNNSMEASRLCPGTYRVVWSSVPDRVLWQGTLKDGETTEVDLNSSLLNYPIRPIRPDGTPVSGALLTATNEGGLGYVFDGYHDRERPVVFDLPEFPLSRVTVRDSEYGWAELSGEELRSKPSGVIVDVPLTPYKHRLVIQPVSENDPTGKTIRVQRLSATFPGEPTGYPGVIPKEGLPYINLPRPGPIDVGTWTETHGPGRGSVLVNEEPVTTVTLDHPVTGNIEVRISGWFPKDSAKKIGRFLEVRMERQKAAPIHETITIHGEVETKSNLAPGIYKTMLKSRGVELATMTVTIESGTTTTIEALFQPSDLSKPSEFRVLK